MTHVRCRAFAGAVAVTLVTLTAFADNGGMAQEASTGAVERCVDAHGNARLLRLKEQWLDAREAMTRCAEDSCPLAIRSDCQAWLEELALMLPTLLVVVERDDEGQSRVKLEVDTRALELPAELGPIEMLPGTHRLRFSLAGYASVEQTLVLEKGEKNHVVKVRFVHERRAAPLSPQPAGLTPPAPVPEPPIPTVTYLLGGGSLTAFTLAGVLLQSALSSRAEASERCAPACTKSERRSIQNRLVAADAVGGVGLLLGGLAFYTFEARF